MTEGDPLAELRRWQGQIEALPEPVAYIVLDHSWSFELPHVEGRDKRGRKYLLCSPAMLGLVRHVRADELGEPLARLTGIPVYQRENMPAGWPDG